MSHVRISASVVALGIALALPLGAQTRPNFAGKWTLVIEKSTPSTPERHQREITIAQDGQTFTLTQIALVYSASSVSVPPGGTSAPVVSRTPAEEVPYTITYECYGAEHPSGRDNTKRSDRLDSRQA